MVEFREKFIAFIDILGFKRLVAEAEAGIGFSLQEITELVGLLGSSAERDRFDKYGPTCCPESRRIEKNMDFRVSQVSDCVVVSAEISPAGAINIVNHCWGVVISLLQKGVMCRGYISKGSIHHTESHFIGTGYQNVLEAERQVAVFKRAADERGTPFVEVDHAVCDFIAGCDACVKEMFSRMTKNDGESVALFPFKRLSHSFMIAGFGVTFDPDKEKRSNDNLRTAIITFRNKVAALVDSSNPDAMRKAEHYIGALNAQVDVCTQTDEMIDKLCTPFPSPAIYGRKV